ncbi:MAG: hypothetical protein V2B20_10215 [Pseudomonadota bacterium]
MKLHFQCPQTGKIFSTDGYSLTDNRGVILNSQGEKILQAMVEVSQPCPHCQEFHRYRVEDLACPLTYR